MTSDQHVAQLVDVQSNLTRTLSLLVVPDVQSSFVVDARHIGTARLLVRLSVDDCVTLETVDYTVRVSRQGRAVDSLFTWAVLGQALFNAFAVGSGADWQRIKRHLADNVADFLAPLMLQFLLLPAVKFNNPLTEYD